MTTSATALKTDTPILDTAAGIQSVPEQVIDDQKATQISEAVRNISSVQTAGSSGNRSQNLTVRGFAAGRFAKDGFLAPASFGDTALNDLANVARVEVLKGPASILYGQTEPGGLVHIVTNSTANGSTMSCWSGLISTRPTSMQPLERRHWPISIY